MKREKEGTVHEEIKQGPRLGDGQASQELGWLQGDQLSQQADIQAKAHVLPADTLSGQDPGYTWLYNSFGV